MEQTSLMTRLGSTLEPILLTAGLSPPKTQNPKLKTLPPTESRTEATESWSRPL